MKLDQSSQAGGDGQATRHPAQPLGSGEGPPDWESHASDQDQVLMLFCLTKN